MKTKFVALALALVLTAASSAFAVDAGDAPVTLAAIFAPSTSNAASMTKVTCIASCGSTTVSCSYNPPSTCVAVDRNCSSGQQGYVSCNGVTTYCPSSCGVCTNGATRIGPWTGACCDNGGRLRKNQQCVNGQWVDTGSFFCGIPCGGIDPPDPIDPHQ